MKSNFLTACLCLMLTIFLIFPLLVPIYIIDSDTIRNYNEGWNAYFTSYVFSDKDLYPSSNQFIFNNYPPAGFFIVGLLSKIVGDPILAGRIASVLSLAGVAILALTVVYHTSRNLAAGLVASVLAIFVTSANVPAYVATNDPQWLAHLLQLAGLAVLILRQPASPKPRDVLLAFALVLAGGLVKHNLLAVPVAVTLWLAIFYRRMLWVWLVAAIISLPVLAILAQVTFGSIIFSDIFGHSRIFSVHQMARNSLAFGQIIFPYMILACVSIALAPRSRTWAILSLYFFLSIVFGFPLLGGLGTNVNILFDVLMASALLCGMLVAAMDTAIGTLFPRVSILLAASLVLAPISGDISSFMLRHFLLLQEARKSEAWDLAIKTIADRPGPVMCEDPQLCFRAGKDFEVDFFNWGQAVATGRRTSDELDAKIAARQFAAIELATGPSSFRLPDSTNRAIAANYRVIQTEPVVIAVPNQ